MDALIKDLRFGLRMLLKNPGSTLLAMVALGLGIGASTAIFSVVNAVLLRPLRYKDSDRLVVIWETKPAMGILQEFVSPPNYRDWVAQNRSFDQIGALRAQPSILTGGQLPERVETALVSPSLLDMLGAKVTLGRNFRPDEDQPGRNRVALVSHGLWQRRYGGDPGIRGKAIVVDGNSYTIVGVAEPEFHLPDSAAELWMPYTLDAKEENSNQRGFRTLRVLAHLKPGVSLEQAQSDMRAVAGRLEQQYFEADSGYSAKVVPLRDQLVGNVQATLWTLLAAVAVVLLIACANVANLLLARAAGREREMALRTALGANPSRLMRQLLTESMLLAVASGLLGLALAAWSVPLLGKFGPANFPRLEEITIDGRVLAVTLLVSLATGIIFGFAPAVSSLHSDLNSILKSSGRGTTSSRGHARLRDAVVVIQIVFCVVLLSAAGLLARSFLRLQNVNPGFQPDHVLTMQLALPETRYSGRKVAQFHQRLLERLESLAGVRFAGIARNLPLSGADASLNFTIENRPVANSADQPRAKYRAASANYFVALGIPLVRGRYLDRTDGEKTPGVAVINSTMARRFFPNEDPIGKRIKAGFDNSVWSTIVGIVGDVKHAGLDAETNPEIYYQYQQVPPALMSFVEGTMTLVLRTNTEPTAMVTGVRGVVQMLDGDLAVFNVKTMQELLAGSLAQARFRTLLVVAFAGVALILAAIGLYGVIAYTVTQRTNEIGVRMALGAQKGDVLGLVVGHSARLAAIGVGIGLVAAFALLRVISNLLFRVTAADPVTFAVTAVLILAVSLAASGIPALKAIAVDPLKALRYE
jgi:putative ABC transport system permease protein